MNVCVFVGFTLRNEKHFAVILINWTEFNWASTILSFLRLRDNIRKSWSVFVSHLRFLCVQTRTNMRPDVLMKLCVHRGSLYKYITKIRGACYLPKSINDLENILIPWNLTPYVLTKYNTWQQVEQQVNDNVRVRRRVALG